MRIEQFAYIVDVAESGSIAQSAKRLFVTPSSMSMAIAGLEKELGVTVFERSSRGLTPTIIGREVIGRAEQILALVDEMTAMSSAPFSGLSGALNIMTERANSFGPILPMAIDRVKRLYPGLDVGVKASDMDEMVGCVQKGEADIALLGSLEGKESARLGISNAVLNHVEEHSDLAVTPIFKSEIVVYFDKRSPFARQKVVTKDDLRNWPIITRSDLGEAYLKEALGNDIKPLRFIGNRRAMDYLIAKKSYVSFDTILSLKLEADWGSEIAFRSIVDLRDKLTMFAVSRRDNSNALVGVFLQELRNQAELFRE